MESYRRTQVYLSPADHDELRRVAGSRGVSMTTLVREAVSRYLAEADRSPDRPRWSEPDYNALGVPPGSAGLAGRMRARSASPPPSEPPAPAAHDRDIGEFLYREHRRQRAASERAGNRRGANAADPPPDPWGTAAADPPRAAGGPG